MPIKKGGPGLLGQRGDSGGIIGFDLRLEFAVWNVGYAQANDHLIF